MDVERNDILIELSLSNDISQRVEERGSVFVVLTFKKGKDFLVEEHT